MKQLFLIISFLPHLLWSQYLFDFEMDPAGSTGICAGDQVEQLPAERWECQGDGAISGEISLRHYFDNPEAGCDYFIVKVDPLQETDSLLFSFRLRHGYSPSSANNWQVAFLAEISRGSDQEGATYGKKDLITGGLILGVNYTGSDDMVKLWECQDGIGEERCVTSLNYQEQVGTETAPEFRVIWYRGGVLKIWFSADPVESPYEQIGSCLLDTLPGGRYLVIRYEYSSARDRSLWLDDIKLVGHFVRDTAAPEITGVEVLDGNHLQISFSEQVALPHRNSFRLSGSTLLNMIPDTIYQIQRGVVLEFPAIIPNREMHHIRVMGVCDMDANCFSDTVITFLRNSSEWGDLVFNELMVDPAPAVLLPDVEYLEIFNRSAYETDLTGWRLAVNDRSHMITELNLTTGLLLAPGSYGLISGITLPNEGATLALYSETGALIHAVRYNLPWNGPDWKKEGGWSLESPDPDLLCNISNMWEYSSNRQGGTPGTINSNDAELEEVDPPLFLYAGYGDQPGELSLQYSEPVRFSSQEVEQFIVLPGKVYPDSVVSSAPMADQLLLWFPEDLQLRHEYKLQLPAIADCAGNRSRSLEIRAGRISEVRFGSLLINEIMYDPEEGAPEFIELFHPGEDFVDLRDLSLDVGSGGISPVSPVPLSDHSRIISPGEYLVVSRNVDQLMDAYNLELSGQLLEVKKLDGLNNSGGTVYLTDRAGAIVDMALYEDQMHMDLMDVTQGVSLERISAERSGNVADNWHSAASIEGYSTPGRSNSQSLNGIEYAALLKVEPKVFSPDNDGYQDLLQISISPGTQGWVIRMWITDLTGQWVWSLADNHLAGPSVTYTWNGERGGGQMAAGGIYVVHVRSYNPVTGEIWNRKEAVGLIYR
ncbi:MAG: lamin tail domain-containing protein [Bacteroidota bacterium]